jgi:FAD:protein FMN transferase
MIGVLDLKSATAPPARASFERLGTDYRYEFRAMATPCEVRLETADAEIAGRALRAAEMEARRIEAKFSRYLPESVISRINTSNGKEIEVDQETAHIVDFAAHCFELSDGLFDITSGVLRRIWRFDGSDRVPTQDEVGALRQFVGWKKVSWNPPIIRLPAGAEIDLGGLGKEYAVDRALQSVREITTQPALVNFGGDLRVSGPRLGNCPWKVAIESVEQAGQVEGMLEIQDGALATSGDARRFLSKDGIRYGHILDPRTGWPVVDPLRSVTVASSTCIHAGMIATLAILQGPHAEAFLKREQVRAWYIR